MAPDPRFWRCVIKAVCLALQTYIDLFEALEGINWATFIIGMVSIVILVVNNELIKVKLSQMFPSTYHHHMFVLKPRLAKLCSFPVPIQLIIVIIGTGVSYGFNFNEKYDVAIVGCVEKG